MNHDAAIRIDSIRKSYGENHAVRDLSLEVPRGSLCGFLGPNGAGKSTTIRMIMSIMYPDRGTINVLGGTALESKDRIGYLPEERGVYRKMRVVEFVRYIARLKGADRRGFDRVIEDWLDRIELPGVAKKRCEELSKGMQQKVQFLAAIINAPELIILDEPFSGLDPVNAEVIHGIVQDLHDDGRTIIFSTHILQQAERLCDRIVLINRGQKLLDESMPSIRARFSPRELQLEPEKPEDAALVTESLAPRDDVVAVRPAGESVIAELAEGADPRVTMQVLLAELPLRGVSLRRVSLEEVFINLVSAGDGRAAAEVARRQLAGMDEAEAELASSTN
ncbi:MAG: ABC transporter ATP-binding protein [Phycisphaerales bacterium]